MTMTDFGAPVPVTELPPVAARGGRQSNVPALTKWLEAIAPTGTFELASKDADGGHPVSRVTQLRKLAEPMGIKVDTRAIETGKRYRIYATRAAATANAEPVKNARKR